MRPAHEPHAAARPSGTPIYDALFAEYRRLFRALPGDRSGEEQLRFDAIMNSRPSLPSTGRLRPHVHVHRHRAADD
ncbi:hypothetical protein AA958_04885 [Streptomyces sp. CNQ-509]|uniref:hypothetical protein n=1 Tax=unclassified Streptomyces TaxID=2593676 RepID=UPI00062DD412|nr:MULTISPECIES: hypothetical protein [unclassified Streptomyces]AKH81639.1 hypothetical protein AA958_04885 [Streptomyces sp. CNQ-509]AZM45286.1 hypothetical protein DMB38_05090 [Streptomyces sp. WAC 06738]